MRASTFLLSRCSVLLTLLCLSVAVRSQVIPIDNPELQQHLLTHPDPIYPAIAKAAQVQGEVVLQLDIDASGNVTAAKALSGPAMLRGAAQQAVMQWHYQPFLKDGIAQPVSAKIAVPFHLAAPANANDLAVAKAYFPLSDACHKDVSQRAEPAQRVRSCGAAAKQADLFSPNARYIERRSAYVYYASALIADKQFKLATQAGEKAIAVVLQGQDDESGSSAAYGVTGQAKGLGGDLICADKDLETAETFQRKAIIGPAGQSLATEYKYALKSLLLFHAQLLNALGDTARANAKSQEAGTL